MKKVQPRIAQMLLAVFAATITLTGAACSSTPAGQTLGAPKPFTLNYWTVFNESGYFSDIITAFKAQYPQINVQVTTYRPEEYESAIINALAEDRGPDIFSIPNTAVLKYAPKIEPMPAVMTMEQAQTTGLLKKQTFTVQQKVNSLSLRALHDRFVDQVLADSLVNNQVMGLPLAMDDLAIFYNKDLLNAAGIAKPAENYQDLQDQMPKLTRVDRLGNILQSGIAMGTSGNVPRFTDIVSLLMMQNGTQMTAGNSATFNILPAALEGRSSLPAADALDFYAGFASPTKTTYTWNDAQPDALQAFEQGKLAYFLSYSYNLPIIRAQAPKLNFSVAKMLQIPGNDEINFANYWLETVSKKSAHKDAAWDFIQFMTAPDNVKNYLAAAKRPTAVRSLIPTQVDDLDLGVFAEQVLTARSWYHGAKPEAVDPIFAEMIQATHDGKLEMPQILTNGVQKINQTLQ